MPRPRTCVIRMISVASIFRVPQRSMHWAMFICIHVCNVCVNHSFLRLANTRYIFPFPLCSCFSFQLSTGIHLSGFWLRCCAIAVTCVRTPYACNATTTAITCNQQINLQQPCRMLARQGSLICVANLTASTDKAAGLLLALIMWFMP